MDPVETLLIVLLVLAGVGAIVYAGLRTPSRPAEVAEDAAGPTGDGVESPGNDPS